MKLSNATTFVRHGNVTSKNVPCVTLALNLLASGWIYSGNSENQAKNHVSTDVL